MSEPRGPGAGRRVPRWERRLRAVAYFTAFGLIFAVFDVLLRVWAQGWSLVRPHGRRSRFNALTRAWALSLCRLTRLVLRARVELRGEVPEGRFVVITNHQSTADIIFLIEALRPLHCKFVAKKSLGSWIPWVSPCLRHGGSVLIERKGSREDLAALSRFGRELAAWDGSAIIFAEGSRSRDGSLAPFHQAAARVVARESGLPLLPVCIEGTFPASDLSQFARGLLGARILIHVGEPVAVPASGAAFREALGSFEDWAQEVIRREREASAQLADAS